MIGSSTILGTIRFILRSDLRFLLIVWCLPPMIPDTVHDVVILMITGYRHRADCNDHESPGVDRRRQRVSFTSVSSLVALVALTGAHCLVRVPMNAHASSWSTIGQR
jgi:hypothetical protein